MVLKGDMKLICPVGAASSFDVGRMMRMPSSVTLELCELFRVIVESKLTEMLRCGRAHLFRDDGSTDAEICRVNEGKFYYQ